MTERLAESDGTAAFPRIPGSQLRSVGPLSTQTSVKYTLRSVDEHWCATDYSVDYTFRDGVSTHNFVVFVTASALIRDSVLATSRAPLFDAWYVSDPALFQDSAEELLETVQVGIAYTDRKGSQRVDLETRPVSFSDVGAQYWADYLSLFSEPFGSIPTQSIADHYPNLRILELDLNDIARSGHGVDSIQQLALRFSTLHRKDDAFCYWYAAFRCHIDNISLDVNEFAFDEGKPRLFRIFPFMPDCEVDTSWCTAGDLRNPNVDTWLQPGHGFSLLWRSS